MKTKHKSLLLALCAVMLVVGSVMGTMAYLTFTTDTVTNTFTVGSVKLGNGTLEEGLDEADVDEYGSIESTDRVQGNEYKLVPGHEYIKDPTVHVAYTSENCYVYVKVENGIAAIEAEEKDGYKKVANQILDNGWTALPGVTDVYYKSWTKPAPIPDTDKTDDLVVFEEFKVEGEKVASELEAYATEKILVTAYAVQADGFDSAEAAWGATFGK